MYDACEQIALAAQTEHRRLRQRLCGIEQLLTASRPPPEALRRIQDEFMALNRQLSSHFDREERGGFLDEAIAFAPRFGDDVNRLIREHAVLLAKLTGAIQLARRGTAADYSELRDKSLDLFHSLRLHEAGEDRVLQQVFPSELSTTSGGDDA